MSSPRTRQPTSPQVRRTKQWRRRYRKDFSLAAMLVAQQFDYALPHVRRMVLRILSWGVRESEQLRAATKKRPQ
jgi:hypothetical protein